jgi:hypothetical protein
MEVIEFLEDKLTEGDYVRVCRLMADQAPPLTINDLTDNICERMPRRGTGFYLRLATLISNTLTANLEQLHIKVLAVVGSRNLRETCLECIIYGIKEQYTWIRTDLIFSKLPRDWLQ